MAYQIDKFNNEPLTVIPDGTIDQTTDLKLIGRYYPGYGEIQNENFLYLLENFANETNPPKPIIGQLWFDTQNNTLKVYDGDQWNSSGVTEAQSTQPSGQNTGDLWWNTQSLQLYAFNGVDYTLVGPERLEPGQTRIENTTIRGLDSIDHPAIVTILTSSEDSSETVVTVTSQDTEYSVDTDDAGNIDLLGEDRFLRIKPGLNIPEVDADGVSGGGYVYWGTSSSALGLVINDEFIPAEDFVTSTSGTTTEFTGEVRVGSRLLIGNAPDDAYIQKVGNALQMNSKNVAAASSIYFTVSSGGDDLDVFEIRPDGLFPLQNLAVDIGSETQKVNQMYAQQFNGEATSALYADLAEKYTTGMEYPTGTVVAVCSHGDHDVCLANYDDVAVGVISEKPAFIMNSGCDGQAVALKGRVPVRVIGPVHKGEKVYSCENGIASTNKSDSLVGIALETAEEPGEKLVECILKV